MASDQHPSKRSTVYNEPPSDTVILYSGGLDSYIAAVLNPGARLVYIDTGAVYAWKELRNLAHAPRGVWVDKRLSLSDMERADGIVPARNALLAIIGSYYADNIVLVSTSGDRSTDKDEAWAGMMSQLMRHMYSLPHFDPPREINVLLPYKDMSKGQLVREYLRRGHNPDGLRNAVSCYAWEGGHCGCCKACMRKWIALESNGIPTTGWHTPPSLACWDDVVRAIRNGGWRCPDEDARTMEVLQRFGVV